MSGWRYSTNIMGPISLQWFEDNNIPYVEEIKNNRFTDFKDQIYKKYEPYFGGRIDCYCSDESDPDYNPYNQELSLPIMHGKYFGKFSDWLMNFQSKRWIDSFEKIRSIYEKETGEQLILHSEETRLELPGIII